MVFGAFGEDGGAAGGFLVGPLERGAGSVALGFERRQGLLAVRLPGRLGPDVVKAFL